jgi:acyl carrier protein
MDFIELFNEVVKLAKPVTADDSFAKSLDDKFEDLNLDSLDHLMLLMYFGSIYGIEEEVLRESKYTTVSELQEFLVKHRTNNFDTLEQALEYAK